MSRVYDNWERLVGAVLKREQLRDLARCPSTTSSDYSYDSDSRRFDNRSGAVGKSATGGVAGRIAALLFAAPARAFALYRRTKPHVNLLDLPEFHLGHLKRFSLRELQVASDNFSNKIILRRRGFFNVYKGQLADGSLVEVKRLHGYASKEYMAVQFRTEVQVLSMAMHQNVLPLCGFCITPTELLLVYPYMANGSVASCLTDRSESQPVLDWAIRKRIALGSARGLAYLHHNCDPKIIHSDVKADNMLLDEDFETVVGEIGLAHVMDCKETHITREVRGTLRYIAPEYLISGKVSEKIDVFSYGMMLLELITGQRTFDLARLAYDDDVMLQDWVKGVLSEKKLEMLVDANLMGNYIDDEVEQLIEVALRCTQISPTERPKMSEVVRVLEGHQQFRQELNHMPRPNNIDWIILSPDISPVELSGPR